MTKKEIKVGSKLYFEPTCIKILNKYLFKNRQVQGVTLNQQSKIIFKNMDTNNETIQSNDFTSNPEPIAKKPFNKWIVSLIILVIIILIVGLVFMISKFTKKQGQETGELNKQTKTEEKIKEPAPLIRYGQVKLVLDKSVAKVNEEINAQILMDTQNSNIVVASAFVQYDAKVLKLVNIDDKKSVLTMSIMKKDNNGLIEIVRGIPGNANPDDSVNGYTGSEGLLASLKFKVLKSGVIDIRLNPEKTKLILDDGRGTEMKLEIK